MGATFQILKTFNLEGKLENSKVKKKPRMDFDWQENLAAVVNCRSLCEKVPIKPLFCTCG